MQNPFKIGNDVESCILYCTSTHQNQTDIPHPSRAHRYEPQKRDIPKNTKEIKGNAELTQKYANQAHLDTNN